MWSRAVNAAGIMKRDDNTEQVGDAWTPTQPANMMDFLKQVERNCLPKRAHADFIITLEIIVLVGLDRKNSLKSNIIPIECL